MPKLTMEKSQEVLKELLIGAKFDHFPSRYEFIFFLNKIGMN